ncbi:hypothetical protein PSTG_19956, partial [Puccinia striiformis f. sp. tritici PST-78]
CELEGFRSSNELQTFIDKVLPKSSHIRAGYDREANLLLNIIFEGMQPEYSYVLMSAGFPRKNGGNFGSSAYLECDKRFVPRVNRNSEKSAIVIRNLAFIAPNDTVRAFWLVGDQRKLDSVFNCFQFEPLAFFLQVGR